MFTLSFEVKGKTIQEVVEETQKALLEFLDSRKVSGDLLERAYHEQIDAKILDMDARTETFTIPEKSPEEKTVEAITKPDVKEEKVIPEQNKIYDSAGFPWDARIHADSKEFNRDGTWRRRRKLDEDFIKNVEAELKGLTPQQEKSEPVKDATVQATVPVPPVPGIPSQVTLTPPPVHAPVSQPVNKYAHTFLSFRRDFTETLASLMIDKKITQEYINQLKDYFQVKEIFDITKDNEKMEELFENFCAAGLITRVA